MSEKPSPDKLALYVALGLTLILILLHVLAVASAGGLWRDEANTVEVATLPSLRDVWMHLQYDSFPLLWQLIVRAVAVIAGPANDLAFRALTFVIGIVTLGALWLNARVLPRSYPLVSLALFAMSPNVIRWGHTLRAYEFGIALGLITSVLLWRIVEKPTRARYIALAVTAIASVHVLFYSAVLLFAFSAGAAAVCLKQRAFRKLSAIMVVGLVAAASLVPYGAVVRNARDWNVLVRRPEYTLAFFWDKLSETINLAGPWAMPVWCLVVALAVTGSLYALCSRYKQKLTSRDLEVLLFALVSLSVGSVTMFAFLKILSYETEPWYYFSLMALVAVCADTVLGVLAREKWIRLGRIAAVLLVVAATSIPARRAARTRLTDVDVLASQLRKLTRPGDVVLVAPWQYGVSFNRYYHGAARWMTVPTLGFYRYHRYDIVKQLMSNPDQTAAVSEAIDQAGAALKTGHRVFVAGGLMVPDRGQAPTMLKPAPVTGQPYAWPEGAYDEQWMMMVGYFLEHHAVTTQPLTVFVPLVVHRFENLSLSVATGWQP